MINSPRLLHLIVILLFFAIVSKDSPELHQMNVKTAFFKGNLNENISMEQPDVFVDRDDLYHVFRLLKALYGLEQAQSQWFAKINSFRCRLCLETSTSDPCFYINRTETSLVLITLYLDDWLLAGSDYRAATLMSRTLAERLEMENCGKAKHGLGLETTRNCNAQTRKVNRSSLAENFLRRFSGTYCFAWMQSNMYPNADTNRKWCFAWLLDEWNSLLESNRRLSVHIGVHETLHMLCSQVLVTVHGQTSQASLTRH